jgi:hypothetical protein
VSKKIKVQTINAMNSIKKFIQEVGVMSLSIAIAFVLVMGMAIAKGWKEPTQSPPNGNIPAPINVGDVDQIKTGGLSVDEFSAYGNVILKGDVLSFDETMPLDVWSFGGSTDVARITSSMGNSSHYFLLHIRNTGGDNDKFVVKGDGKVGIGTANPTSPLTIADLPEYADAYTAYNAGLTKGALYRTGDTVKVAIVGSINLRLNEASGTNCQSICSANNETCVDISVPGNISGSYYKYGSHHACAPEMVCCYVEGPESCGTVLRSDGPGSDNCGGHKAQWTMCKCLSYT